jgi:hypothetical protein
MKPSIPAVAAKSGLAILLVAALVCDGCASSSPEELRNQKAAAVVGVLGATAIVAGPVAAAANVTALPFRQFGGGPTASVSSSLPGVIMQSAIIGDVPPGAAPLDDGTLLYAGTEPGSIGICSPDKGCPAGPSTETRSHYVAATRQDGVFLKGWSAGKSLFLPFLNRNHAAPSEVSCDRFSPSGTACQLRSAHHLLILDLRDDATPAFDIPVTSSADVHFASVLSDDGSLYEPGMGEIIRSGRGGEKRFAVDGGRVAAVAPLGATQTIAVLLSPTRSCEGGSLLLLNVASGNIIARNSSLDGISNCGLAAMRASANGDWLLVRAQTDLSWLFFVGDGHITRAAVFVGAMWEFNAPVFSPDADYLALRGGVYNRPLSPAVPHSNVTLFHLRRPSAAP